jgi:hypothetical protein
MALVLGTSSGFVTVAPTTDPDGEVATTIDGSSVVTKHTSPAGATRITEIGWYRATGTNTANFEVALYADDAGVAGARLFVDATNSSASSGWLTTAVDWTITENTPYWLALQMDAHTGSSTIDSQTSGGAGMDLLATQTTLNDPYGGGAVADADGMRAIYALVSIPKVLTAETTSYALSVADAGLSWGRSFAADSGSFALTVADAGLSWAHNLSVETGAFVLSGGDVSFGPIIFSAAVGDFVLSGADAEFAWAHSFTAEQGTFTLTGSDAEFVFDGEVITPPVQQSTSVGGGGLSWQDFVSAEFRRKHLSHLLDVEEKKLEKVEKKLKVVRKKLKALKTEAPEGILANLQALEFKREKIENKIQALEVEMVPLELFLEAEIDEDDEEVMGIFH